MNQKSSLREDPQFVSLVLTGDSVSDRVKIIIAQGRHPDETKPEDNSRSAWLFDAVCNLVRQGVPDDTIFSLRLIKPGQFPKVFWIKAATQISTRSGKLNARKKK